MIKCISSCCHSDAFKVLSDLINKFINYCLIAYTHMSSSSSIGEIVELVGSSDKSWEDAAQAAVKEAIKTIRNVHAIEVLGMTAQVDPNTGNIKEYRVGIKLRIWSIGLNDLEGSIGFTINKLDDNLKDLLSELTLFKSPFPVFLCY